MLIAGCAPIEGEFDVGVDRLSRDATSDGEGDQGRLTP
jgi:hypothetical protein